MMEIIKNHEALGKRFGHLFVQQINKGANIRNKNDSLKKKIPRKAICLCDCGQTVKRTLRDILVGQTTSCGCIAKKLFAEAIRKRCTKHGQSTRTGRTPEYRTWHHMKERCLDPNNKNYNTYGAKGITICQEWIDSFQTFFDHVGEKPEPKRLYSLDRINNAGNYEPGNVRWATQKEQVNNSSTVKQKIVINCEWCNNSIILIPCLARKRKYCSKSCAAKSANDKRIY